MSGGGKSEISKSIADATIAGPVFVANFKKDMDLAEEILHRNYRDRFREGVSHDSRGRDLLNPDRSLGSVIKLLTPNQDYTDAYNQWLRGIPRHVKDLVLILKRFHRPEWGSDWKRRFSVDIINGAAGNEFGRAVSLSGDTALVGALHNGAADSGSAYVFVRSGTS